MSIISEIRDSFKNGSVLTRLIYVNLGVFLSIRIIQLIMLLSGLSPDTIGVVVSFLAVPSGFEVLLVRFWTPFTYMFVHYDFIHILFNILYLYWFGKLFMELITPRLLLRVYILGGLAGALLYFIGMNYVAAFKMALPYNEMIGASGSVMAIMLTVAMYRPNFSVLMLFIGPVRLKYIALFAVIIDIISIPGLSNTGGVLAHIGGSTFGLVFGWMLLKGNISTTFLSSKQKSERKSFWKKKSKLNVSHKRPLTDLEYNAIKVRRQKEVDRILEKIKNSGYGSLSESEKKTLFEASRDGNFQ